MTTEERLENLERELARAKRRNRWLLAGLGLCLGILVVVWGMQGRYAVAATQGGAYVLDTRTGHLWLRAAGMSIDVGTNETPKEESKRAP